jgi:pimeloyl-ACP methyl ester carboxylesterase
MRPAPIDGAADREHLELVFDAHGPESGQPILFLHGAGQTRSAWQGAAAAAGEAGFRALAIDLRGHGDSPWSAIADYRLQTFAADLDRIAGRLPAPPVLVGASLGGLTSLLYAGTGGRARALVLVDITPRFNEQGVAEIEAFMRGHPEGFASLEAAADAVAGYLPHRDRRRDPRGLLKNLRKDDTGRYRWHWDPAFLSGPRPFDAHAMRDTLEELSKELRIPVLLVKGERSRVVSDEAATAFLALVPHAELVEVGGADHMIAGDRNDIFSQVTLDFCRRLRIDR